MKFNLSYFLQLDTNELLAVNGGANCSGSSSSDNSFTSNGGGSCSGNNSPSSSSSGGGTCSGGSGTPLPKSGGSCSGGNKDKTPAEPDPDNLQPDENDDKNNTPSITGDCGGFTVPPKTPDNNEPESNDNVDPQKNDDDTFNPDEGYKTFVGKRDEDHTITWSIKYPDGTEVITKTDSLTGDVYNYIYDCSNIKKSKNIFTIVRENISPAAFDTIKLEILPNFYTDPLGYETSDDWILSNRQLSERDVSFYTFFS